MTAQKEIAEMQRDINLAKNVARNLRPYLTNPSHGGKVCCHTCNGFIHEGDEVSYHDHQHPTEFPAYHFHKKCYNGYQHYYGIDKPID